MTDAAIAGKGVSDPLWSHDETGGHVLKLTQNHLPGQPLFRTE